jgi:hypothetical protein
MMFARCLMLLGMIAVAVPAHAGMSELYGTREPYQCGPFTEIAGSTPTAEEALAIFVCEYERDPIGIASKLFLLEDVSIQVGKGRPFGQSSDYNLRDADTSLEVFPIRGTATRIQCGEINSRNQGANCAETPSRAEGTCYRNTFGEWSCPMFMTDAGPLRDNLPPR